MHREYVRDGNGSTVFLFIHGIMGTPNHFKYFVDLVPDDWGVYNILLDGHGKKPEDISKTSMKIWKKQVDETVEYLAERYEKIIIVAHSMGTLFAVNESVKCDKVKALFLLSIPLAIDVKFVALKNSLKVVFSKEDSFDEVTKAMKEDCGVDLDRKVWKYIGWLPRFAELMVEINRTKEILPMLDIPATIFQSKNDELVSVKSDSYFKTNPEITYYLLENSCHFYYSEKDMQIMRNEFESLIAKL